MTVREAVPPRGDGVEFRLLGPVELRLAGRVVDAGPPQQRLVLAVLAAEVGRPVTTEQLIDRVWGEAPPGARRTLQVYVTRLRRLLGDDAALVRRSGGYALEAEPERVDVYRFRTLLDRARTCPEEEQLPVLRAALAQWAGEPLAGLLGDWADRMRLSWRHQYLDALVTWADAELRCGNPGTVVGPLTEIIGEHPLVEPLSAVLMRALHQCGRTADALDCYGQLRRRLAEELGADPSPEVLDVYRHLVQPGVAVERLPVAQVPAQLPMDIPGFVARRRELDGLQARLAEPGPAVVALSGMAGVGKTDTRKGVHNQTNGPG